MCIFWYPEIIAVQLAHPTTPPEVERPYLLFQEFLTLFRVSKSTVYRHREEYPFVDKLGGRAVVFLDDIEAWKQERTERAQARRTGRGCRPQCAKLS
jgi:predicted DNA-binding transcriptional regulator AlpA